MRNSMNLNPSALLKKMTLTNINNVLLFVVLVLLVIFIFQKVTDTEEYQDSCETEIALLSNIPECSGSNFTPGNITQPNSAGVRYQCGQTDGTAFRCK